MRRHTTRLTDGQVRQRHAAACTTRGTSLVKEFVLWDGVKPRAARGVRAGVAGVGDCALQPPTACLAPFHALPRVALAPTRLHTS